MKKKRSITPAQWSLFGLSVIVVLVLAVVLFRGEGGEKIKAVAEEPSVGSETEPAPPGEAKDVTLFFLSEEDGLLHSEAREIQADPSVIAEARQTVEALIRGSEKGYINPLPPETRLRQLFLTKEGIAYVDFSKEIMETHPSGSSAELGTVYSIVNTLTFNFKPIKRVFILVEGSEKETLGGHINLNRAFAPQFSLNAR
ncbi:MAG: GerMN domain-containing protein [Candidatus Aminicenantes bacterium]|nr:GerMN domain-containing protein [Candidatus Aminicenantes bacterium]